MTKKHVTSSFFVYVLSYIASMFLSALLSIHVSKNIYLSDIVRLLPFIIIFSGFYIQGKQDFLEFKNGFTRDRGDVLKQIKIALILLPICLPALLFINYLTSTIVGNAVAMGMGALLEFSPIYLLIVSGILIPIIEEILFRHVYFQTLKKEYGLISGVLLSSVMFGLYHCNLNQLSYAILFGVIACLVDDAFNSILPSTVMHILINSSNIVFIYLFPYNSDYTPASNDVMGIVMDIICVLAITISLFFTLRYLQHIRANCVDAGTETVETEGIISLSGIRSFFDLYAILSVVIYTFLIGVNLILMYLNGLS